MLLILYLPYWPLLGAEAVIGNHFLNDLPLLIAPLPSINIHPPLY